MEIGAGFATEFTRTIEHELTYPVAYLAPLFARYMSGGYFVHNIAAKNAASA